MRVGRVRFLLAHADGAQIFVVLLDLLYEGIQQLLLIGEQHFFRSHEGLFFNRRHMRTSSA